MSGAYCRYCDRRCFVDRVVPGSVVTHLATCPKGMAHDRAALGVDHTTAINPLARHAGYLYIASSWRNEPYTAVLDRLRREGFPLYDFRNPEGGTAFAWSDIDPQWRSWTAREYVQALNHPRAVAGYASDFAAMQRADTIVLVLPAGRSAHLELGWAAGQGKRTAILTRDGEEPELMAKMIDLVTDDLDQLVDWLSEAS